MVEFILLAIFAVFFIIIFFVIFAEFVLYVCEKVFGKRRFGLIEELPPPLSNGLYVKRIQFKQVATSSNSLYRPNLKNKNQLKVALFGGSAAQGYSSERSAAEMLAVLIRDQAPDMDVYVANYAANGGSFHRFQAEILKSVIDFYDILVVYAGNNEDIPYWEHNGVWSGEILADQSFPDPQAKFIIEEEGKALRASLTFFLSANFLNYKSRLYAFCVRVSQKFTMIAKVQGVQNRSKSSYLNSQKFRDSPIVPYQERKKIVDRFGEDINKISTMIIEKNKKFIYANVVSNEEFPPFFSVYDKHCGDEDKSRIISKINKIELLIASNELTKALELLEELSESYPNLAIIKFYMGACRKQLGDTTLGHGFSRQSINLDGFTFRSTDAIHHSAISAMSGKKNSHYIDTIKHFYEALKNGWTWDELYNDPNHASFAGNALIAQAIANQISDIEDGMTPYPERSPFSKAETNKLAETMKVSHQEKIINLFMAARWHLGLSAASGYPEYMLEKAENVLILLEKMLKNPNQNEGDQKYFVQKFYLGVNIVVVLVFRAFVCIRKGDISSAIKLGNKAFSIDPHIVRDIVEGKEKWASSLPLGSIPKLIKESDLHLDPSKGFYTSFDEKSNLHTEC